MKEVIFFSFELPDGGKHEIWFENIAPPLPVEGNEEGMKVSEKQEHRVNLVKAVQVDDDGDLIPSCICGSSMEWVRCFDCGGDGEINRYDEDPPWYGSEEDAWEKCETCGGKGGWYVCLAQPREEQLREDGG